MLELEVGIRKWAYLSVKSSKENGHHVFRVFEKTAAVRARRRCRGYFLLLNVLDMGWELGIEEAV